jgi:hypothetical protein
MNLINGTILVVVVVVGGGALLKQVNFNGPGDS